jgi:hypothetical protein
MEYPMYAISLSLRFADGYFIVLKSLFLMCYQLVQVNNALDSLC